MRSITWIIRLYPRKWRERYETELLAVLEQHDRSLVTVFDLLLGALDARLDPHYKSERMFLSFKSVRVTALTFTFALAVFTFLAVVGNILMGLCPCWGFSPGSLMSFIFPALTHSFAGLWMMLFVSNLILSATIVRNAIAERRKGTLLLGAVCFFLLFAPIMLLLHQIPSPPEYLDLAGYFMHFESLLMGLVTPLFIAENLFIMITMGRDVTIRRQKGLWFPAVFIFLLMPLCLFLLLIEVPVAFNFFLRPDMYNIYRISIEYPALYTFLHYGRLMIDCFSPFTGLAALFLAITRREMSMQTLRLALMVAIGITLVMGVILSATISYDLTSLVNGVGFVPLAIVAAAMTLVLGVALVALINGFKALAASSKTLKEAPEMLIAE